MFSCMLLVLIGFHRNFVFFSRISDPLQIHFEKYFFLKGRRMRNPSARDTIRDIILEFLEAYIHQILYVRGVYSSELFEARQLYGISVWKARHPELCSYIGEAVSGLKV